jgi:hypothetical protein
MAWEYRRSDRVSIDYLQACKPLQFRQVPEAALGAQVRYITVIVDIGRIAGELLGAFLIPEGCPW